MKTLGQIAYEFNARPENNSWAFLPDSTREQWNMIAQAVRAAVIEECAKELDTRAMDEHRGHNERATILCCSTWVRDLGVEP